MNKILISTSSFDVENNQSIDQLRSCGYEIVLNPYKRRLSEDEAAELLSQGFVGMIAGVEPLTARVLRGAKSLRVIARAGIGLDSVDLASAQALGISVSNTPQAPVAAVAELSIGLILNVLRSINAADRDLRAGTWNPRMGRLLGAQSVGLIGCGRIGRAVLELLRPFGCRLQVCDPMFQGDAVVRNVTLDELMATSDIISLHVPYDNSTHHLIGADQFAKMKEGAILVNTARGGLIDEAALCVALDSEHLFGAAIDTFEKEPYSGVLTSASNVILTAHMGSYAKESRSRMEREAAENLVAGLRSTGILSNHD